MAKKRETVEIFDFISHEIIQKIKSIHDAEMILKKEFFKYHQIEAIYLIEALSSKQIHDTIMDNTVENCLKPTKHGDEHLLKEYFYITMESKKGTFLSKKYISFATGNLCKTFAKTFDISQHSYILCLDIVIEGN